MDFDIVIVGAGHAGAQAAISLRQQKFEGSIAIIGEEPELPYERPPLSKEYFAGEKTFERIMIRPEKFWTERNVEMILSTRIISIDPEAKRINAEDGGSFGYSKLIWATGAALRKLQIPGSDLSGIHYVRSRADVDRMMTEAEDTSDVAVIGGGYIGLEAAAVLRKMGKTVTVIEALDRVLARVAGEELSRFFEAEHSRQGAQMLLNSNVTEFLGENGRISGLELGDGSEITAQMVIVGIGVIAATEPLIAAGAIGDNGVDINEFCQTSLPNIYAVGDCAAHINKFAGNAKIRLESVQNANDQATTAAKSIMGVTEPYQALPWFWSNQYDLKLQTAGLSTGYDQTVIRGDIDERSFSIVYLKEGKVIALDCVNALKDYVQGRKLVEAEMMIDPDDLQKAPTIKELMSQ